MPIWEGIVASACAGIVVSLLNKYGISRLPAPPPCEPKTPRAPPPRRHEDSSDSSDDSGEIAAAASTPAHGADALVHHGDG